MAKIQRKVLTLLEALYRFTSSQDGAPSEFQLGLGITPVHDLSRMAQIGSALINRDSAGYWVASIRAVHVAPGTLNVDMNFVTPGSSGEGYIFVERTHWIWIMEVWGRTNDTGDFAEANVSINPITNDFFIGPSEGIPDSVASLIQRWTAAIGSGIMIPTIEPEHGPSPVLLLSPQDGVRFNSVADNVGTVTNTLNMLLWIGLRNTFPPGLH